MKFTEELKKYKGLSEKDLLKEIVAKRKELTLLSLSIKAGKTANFSEVNKSKKRIARLNTILNEKKYSGVQNG